MVSLYQSVTYTVILLGTVVLNVNAQGVRLEKEIGRTLPWKQTI